jgi:hypothetical protein
VPAAGATRGPTAAFHILGGVGFSSGRTHTQTKAIPAFLEGSTVITKSIGKSGRTGSRHPAPVVLLVATAMRALDMQHVNQVALQNLANMNFAANVLRLKQQ